MSHKMLRSLLVKVSVLGYFPLLHESNVSLLFRKILSISIGMDV